MPFTTLGLGPKITAALRESDYSEPTPIQAKAIPLVLEGRDVIGIAQTGTGKTAAFVLPMLERLASSSRRRGVRALVIAPTRELAIQIEENVRKYGRNLSLRFTTIYGGVGEQPQITALRRGVDLIVATPGRLLDLMGRRFVDFRDLEFVVLDEADRMLDMGFLPSIRRIVAALPSQRQTLLFSATFSKEIESITGEFQQRPALAQIGNRSTPAELVTQTVVEVSKEDKVAALVELLKDRSLETVLVFSRTKHGADKIARKLASAGVAAATIHSNRSQSQRISALNRFRSGEARVLIATDIAARGIDVEGITHVINFDFPPQVDDYVHRIGRTGRAEAAGDAISFVTRDDEATLRQLERSLGRTLGRRRIEGLTPTRSPIVAARGISEPRTASQDQRTSRRHPAPGASRRGRSSRPSRAEGRPRTRTR
jgi:ATP-dependent RNA helicase RhlE